MTTGVNSTDNNHHDDLPSYENSDDEQPNDSDVSDDSFSDDSNWSAGDSDIFGPAVDGLQLSTNQASSMHVDEDESVKHFQYESLDPKGRYFRLLRLRKGDELRLDCELFHAQMDGEEWMPYEALSYTWGSLVTNHNILVNGKRLSITANLYSALRNLQFEDEDRILWVDAICIDQKNNDERGAQVNQMGDIFSRADRVIFWLGDSTNNSDLIIRALIQLEQSAINVSTIDWAPNDGRWRVLWVQGQPQKKISSFDYPRLLKESLKDLLSRNWFRRIWIIQEVVRAKRAVVCCGNKSVSSRFFVLAPYLVELQPDSHCQSILDIMPGPLRQRSWWMKNRDLYTLIHKFGHNSEASDKRDMVYALLGIADLRGGSITLTPDYAKSEAEVVAAAILEIFGLEDSPYCTMRELLQNIGFLNTRALLKIATTDPPLDLGGFFEQRRELIKLTADGFQQRLELAAVVKASFVLLNANPRIELLYDSSCGDYPKEIIMLLICIATKHSESGPLIMDFLLAHPIEEIKWNFIKTITASSSNRDRDGGTEIGGTSEEAYETIPYRHDLRNEMMESFLSCHGHQLVTYATLRRDTSIVKSLLGHHYFSEKWVSRDAIIAAAQDNIVGNLMMDLFLCLKHARSLITEEVLEFAARNDHHGGYLLGNLLEGRDSEIDIPDRVLKAAVKNPLVASDLVRLHLGHESRSQPFFLGSPAQSSPASRARSLPSTGVYYPLPSLRPLLSKIEHIQELITVVLLEKEVRSEDCTEELLDFLLVNRAQDVKITRGILRAAERCSEHWASKYLLLLNAFYQDGGLSKQYNIALPRSGGCSGDSIPASIFPSLIAMDAFVLQPFQRIRLLELQLQKTKQSLGVLHLHALFATIDLAHAYVVQGMYEKAEYILSDVVEKWRGTYANLDTSTKEAVDLLLRIVNLRRVMNESSNIHSR